MKDLLASVVKMLLKSNRIKIDFAELEFQLRSHPTYPSLHSITGVLDHFSIKNFALEVPKNAETLGLLPSNFLALIKEEQFNGFALVSKLNQKLQLFYNDNKKKIISENEFIDIWSGIVVIIEEDNKVIIQDSKKENFTNRNILIATIALITVFFVYKNTLFPTVHYLLSLVGLAVCILILHHDLGISSKVLSKFCSEGNKKTSCDEVLKSKGANLFGYFKLSDIGIIYFASLILSWILLKNSALSNYPLIIISLLALPFTFFSIFYQFKIVKKWCLLCLSVVSILWLQAIAIIFSNFRFNELQFNLNAILITTLCFLVSFAFWRFISPKFKKEQELNTLRIEHFKFKRNYNIFKSLIGNSNQIDTRINITNEIILGRSKENALLEVVVITNPLCGFCKESHRLVEKLIKIEGKSINIIIRFNVKADLDSIDAKISWRLLEIYNINGDQICLDAMHDIYSTTLPKDWLLKWGEPSKSEYIPILTNEKGWCEQHNINFTPEILVNGRSFPREYDRIDLMNFIDDIIEEEVDKVNNQAPELNLINQDN